MGVELGKPSSDADWKVIRDLCGKTANAGAGIPERRWPFFGEFWVGPYQKLAPEWTFVARDPEGRIVGYLTGCPDTAPYERKKLVRHTLPLFFKVLSGAYPFNEDITWFLKRFLKLEAGWVKKYPKGLVPTLARDYPAHLHVNVDGTCRGGGVGRKLMGLYESELKKAGVPGVHLYCGASPAGFYSKLGYETLAAGERFPGVMVYAMGKNLVSEG
jgi:GNAT superfamily N-acetyltransferase